MDYYRILQVDRDAEPEVIDKAYKALCLKYHPDVVNLRDGENVNTATHKMQTINEAYAVLGDRKKRAAYDARLQHSASRLSAWDQFLENGLVGMFLNELKKNTDKVG